MPNDAKERGLSKMGHVKKIFGGLLLLLLFVVGVWLIGTGFRKQTAAFVDDYSVDSGRSVMTIHAGVAGSIGYIRKVEVRQAGEAVYLDFISAFGGLNGRIGAKDTYEIPLTENIASVSIAQGDGYQLILKKDAASGQWNPVDWTPRSAQ